ncbi:MAG: hypothetical protein WC651_01650 [Candidatus Gracilibacteria bacterium]|jgi:hypothetical protein
MVENPDSAGLELHLEQGDTIEILEQHPTQETFVKVRILNRQGTPKLLHFGDLETWIHKPRTGTWLPDRRADKALSDERSKALLDRNADVTLRRTDTADKARSLMLAAQTATNNSRRQTALMFANMPGGVEIPPQPATRHESQIGITHYKELCALESEGLVGRQRINGIDRWVATGKGLEKLNLS